MNAWGLNFYVARSWRLLICLFGFGFIFRFLILCSWFGCRFIQVWLLFAPDDRYWDYDLLPDVLQFAYDLR